MLPVFLQHLPPPVGVACGERNYGLFFPGFWQGRNSDFASDRDKTLNFIKNWLIQASLVSLNPRKLEESHRTHKSSLLQHAPTDQGRNPDFASDRHKTLNFIKRLACSGFLGSLNPAKPEQTHKTLKSSLLVAREQPM